MKSQAMKYCTIISDSPVLSAIFFRHASHEAAFFSKIHGWDIQHKVTQIAQTLGYSLDNLFWRQAAVNPVRIGLICPDEIADHLRDELRDHYIIELDCI